jgi:hypothetical protein
MLLRRRKSNLIYHITQYDVSFQDWISIKFDINNLY